MKHSGICVHVTVYKFSTSISLYIYIIYAGEECVLIVGGSSTKTCALADMYILSTVTWKLTKVNNLCTYYICIVSVHKDQMLLKVVE